MPNPILGMVGASAGGGLLQGILGARAARTGANAQVASAQMGIDEQRRQFDAISTLMQPYVQAGTGALQGQQDLIGLGGANAQQAAIAGLAGGVEMQALTQQGENAMLQNASATGGLRGGNTQDALAQFRPQLLSSLINQQYDRLGGLTQMGQASAAGQAAAGMQSANNIGQLYAQQGAARAGGAVGGAQAWGNAVGNISGGLGYGLGAFATPPGSPGGLPAGATMFGRWGF